jgi:hypothetical protein
LLVLAIGAFLHDFDPLFYWPSLIVVPCFHIASAILLLVGHFKPDREPSFFAYISVNVSSSNDENLLLTFR